MQLSNNFRLSEFTRSDTAKRLGIDNECSSVEQVLNLAGGPTSSSPQGENGPLPIPPLYGREPVTTDNVANYERKSEIRKLCRRCTQRPYHSPAPANCPPETGGTRSEATEGVDDTNGMVKTIHPLPLRVLSPSPALNWGV